MDLDRISSRDFEDGRIFVLRGEFDASNTQDLPQLLQGPPGSLVVVDLAEVTFIDSSGLGALHSARRRAVKDGGTFVVSRPQAAVHRVLQITGLDVWLTDWDPRWSQ